MAEDGYAKVKEFFQAGTLLRYGKGEVLLDGNEVPESIFFIERGHLKVYSIRNSGNLNLHLIIKKGEFFPLTLFYGTLPATAYYEAMDAVTVRRCPYDEFQAFVFEHLDVAKYMIPKLSEMLWVYENRIENLELGRAYDKVIFRLLSLAERMGRPNMLGEVVIQAPVTHQDIADSLNMMRETTSREIEKLEQKGIVAYRHHQLVIADIKKLQREMAELH